MTLPYLYLNAQNNKNIEQKLVLVDTYEFPTGTCEDAMADFSDCIDGEDGTLNF